MAAVGLSTASRLVDPIRFCMCLHPQGHLLESETYIGGKVEAIESGEGGAGAG